MAYVNLEAYFSYKQLAIYQDQNQHGANAEYFKSGNAAVSGAWTFTPSAAATAITIDQNNNARGILIDSESTANYPLEITGKYGISMTQDISGGDALEIRCSVNEAGANPLVYVYTDLSSRTSDIFNIIQDHASSSAKTINIQNDGIGYSLNLDQNGNQVVVYIDTEATDKAAIDIDGTSTNTGWLLDVTGARMMQGTITAATGYGIYLSRNVNAASNPLLTLIEDHTGATARGISLRNDGAGDSINIDNNGNAESISIDSSATTVHVIDIDAVNTSGSIIDVKNTGNQTTGELMKLWQSNSSTEADNLEILNDGGGRAIYIDHNAAGGTSPALDIDSGGNYAIDAFNNYAFGYVAKFFNDGDDWNRRGIWIQNGEDLQGATSTTYIEFVDGNGDSVGNITSSLGIVAYNTFTGGHPSTLKGSPKKLEYGMLLKFVSAEKSKKAKYFTEKKYIVEISSKAFDKSIFGIYAGKLENEKIQVHAVGDGHILVTKEGGNIEIGDYLASSNKDGHAMKQKDDLLHNYTIAKSLEAVNWKKEKKDSKLVACTYHAA